MNADLAKTLLQGGWMVTAVKHSQPRCVNCYSPFYITTNKLPDFRTENENVERRIQIFQTTSLPATLRNVDRWIYDNAMHCIAWMVDEINENRDFIDPEELWYEEDADNRLTSSQISQAQWSRTEILQITEADLEPVNTHPNTGNTKDTIHVGFVTEARSRRLARKRQRRRNVWSGDSSSESDVPGNSTLPLNPLADDGAQTSSTPTRDDIPTPRDGFGQPCTENLDNILGQPSLPSSMNVALAQEKTVAQDESMPTICESAVRDQPSTSTGITH